MISLEKNIRTCKVDDGWANKIQSDRFLNPANMVCPIWQGIDSAGRPVCTDSYDTKTAGCNNAEDRVVVENNLRPNYIEYVNLSAMGYEGDLYGGKSTYPIPGYGNFGLDMNATDIPPCCINPSNSNQCCAPDSCSNQLSRITGYENASSPIMYQGYMKGIMIPPNVKNMNNADVSLGNLNNVRCNPSTTNFYSNNMNGSNSMNNNIMRGMSYAAGNYNEVKENGINEGFCGTRRNMISQAEQYRRNQWEQNQYISNINKRRSGF